MPSFDVVCMHWFTSHKLCNKRVNNNIFLLLSTTIIEEVAVILEDILVMAECCMTEFKVQ